MASATVKLGRGRDESYWTESLEMLPPLAELPEAKQVLMLAPHPDDEVLACGGLLQRWSRDKQLDLWMATDGEACFGDDVDVTSVAARRRQEAAEAHRRLGIAANVRWLGLPDSQVSLHQRELREMLSKHLEESDAQPILIAPLSLDGHPDHDCMGAIAFDLAKQFHLLLLQYPIWMWHSGSSDALEKENVVRIELTAAEEIRKRDAIAAFHSQIEPEYGPAVLPRSVLRHFRRSFEVLFVEDFRDRANSSTMCAANSI